MYAQSLAHISEIITGLIGTAIIGVALVSSLRWNRRLERKSRPLRVKRHGKVTP